MSNVFELLNARNRLEVIEHAQKLGVRFNNRVLVDLGDLSEIRAAGNYLQHTLPEAIRYIDTLEAELRTKNDELHTLRFIGQTPEHLDVQPGALQIVPGPPTLIQRIKAAIAAFKGNHATR